MSKKGRSDEFKGWKPAQFDRATRKHIRTANEHLRKSEIYEKDYEKDYALKTVKKSIDRIKRIDHYTGNAKATRDFLNALPKPSPKKRKSDFEYRAMRKFLRVSLQTAGKGTAQKGVLVIF